MMNIVLFGLQGSMLIEYIGSIIRNEVANRREQIYEKQVASYRIVRFPRHFVFYLLYLVLYLHCNRVC